MNDDRSEWAACAAMPAYFFDVAFDDGGLEAADDPVELSGPERAKSEARALAAEMLRARSGRCRSVVVSVRNDEPEPLTSVLISVEIRSRA